MRKTLRGDKCLAKELPCVFQKKASPKKSARSSRVDFSLTKKPPKGGFFAFAMLRGFNCDSFGRRQFLAVHRHVQNAVLENRADFFLVHVVGQREASRKAA